MIKKIYFIFVFSALASISFGQAKELNLTQYNIYFREGSDLIQKEDYFEAYEKFRKAEYWAGADQTRKKAAQDAKKVASDAKKSTSGAKKGKGVKALLPDA